VIFMPVRSVAVLGNSNRLHVSLVPVANARLPLGGTEMISSAQEDGTEPNQLVRMGAAGYQLLPHFFEVPSPQSRRRCASEYAVDLGGHDEVVLMQSMDLLGLQRDRHIAPAEIDVRMMAFGFREFTNFLNKCKGLPEIAKPEAPLYVVSFVR
jgi:hypothetical protein